MLWLACLLVLMAWPAGAQIVSTFAGGSGGVGLPATSVALNAPRGMAVDSAGNLFIAVADAHVVRRVDAATGQISTVAGVGVAGFGGDGGAATLARLSRPSGVAVDGAGHLYIADAENYVVRMVDAATGQISTVAGTHSSGFSGDGGAATSAKLSRPYGVAVDSAGHLYIADTDNYCIRKVDVGTGLISTVAGIGTSSGFGGDGGAATLALLAAPTGVAVDGADNVYIADTGNNRIRRINAATQVINTVAGNGAYGSGGDGGAATLAQVTNPFSVAVGSTGHLYITETYSGARVRKVDAVTGLISTVAGTGTAGFSGDGGAATAAQLRTPWGVAVDGVGHAYIADTDNNRVRKIDAAAATISTVAGTGGVDGVAIAAQLINPWDVATDSAGNVYIADTSNARIRKVDAATGLISTVAGNGTGGAGGDAGAATTAQLNAPRGVAVDSAGNVYLADTFNNRIRRVDAATGVINTVAGTGTLGFGGDGGAATAAQLNGPGGVALDSAGNIYIADTVNGRIRKVDAFTHNISTVMAVSGVYRIAVDGAGHVYIAEGNNHRIRKIEAGTGTVSIVAGTGVQGFSGDGGAATAARLSYPYAIAVDGAGHLYIGDTANQRIRRVDATTGIISTLAGNGVNGLGGDGGAATAAQLSGPYGVAVDHTGHVYIADRDNWRVRKVQALAPDAPTGALATAGNGQATVGWSAPADNGSAIASYTVTAVEDGTRQCTPSPATATTCTVTGLTNGTAYTFTVTATNSVGTSPASAPSTAVTPAGLPAAPTGVTASPGAPGSGTVTLTWTGPTDNGSTITGYTVTPPGTGAACTASPCVVSGLANAAQYSFVVQAVNGVGPGAASASSAAVWLQGAQSITFPPQASQTYAPNGSFAISPAASTTSPLAVAYGSQTPGVCTVSGTMVTMLGAGTCNLTANQAGNAAWAAAAQQAQNVAVGPGVNAINFPAQAGQAFAVGGSFAISPAATGRSSAAVAYSSLATGVCTVSGSTVAMVSAGTCTIAANQAADANWGVAPQATQGVQIAPVAPGAPTDATAIPGNSQALVGWTAPTDTGGGITQYTVTAPGSAGCTAAWPATGCTVSGLVNGVTYTFSIRAKNGVGTSAPAVAQPVTPLVDSKVFAAPSPTGSGTLGVAVVGGGTSCAFERVQVLQASGASTPVPANLQFPHGLLDFVLAGCNQSNVTVTITYPNALPQGVQYWKLQAGNWAPYGGAAATAGNATATLTLVDGGAGDDDGQPNGRIVDPGQVGVMMAAGAGGAAAIPALSQWGMALLATLLGWLGMRQRAWALGIGSRPKV